LAAPLSIALFAVQCQDFIRRYFFVRDQAVVAFANDCLCYLSRLILLVIFLQLRLLNIKEIFWLIAFTAAVATVIGILKIERLNFSRIFVYRVITDQWHFSKWLIVSALMQWTSGNFFLIAAGSILGTIAVGAIKAAQNVMGITHILFQAMENFVPSTASFHFRYGGVNSLINYLKHMSAIGGSITLILVMMTSLFPKFWLSLFYGEIYEEASNVIIYYGPIYLCIFLCIALRSVLRAINYTKAIFIGYLSMTVFSLIFAPLMVTWLGIIGTMVGILVTQVICLSVYFPLFLIKIRNNLNI
jgi:O-antigen/teichoic acid export membrane protein